MCFFKLYKTSSLAKFKFVYHIAWDFNFETSHVRITKKNWVNIQLWNDYFHFCLVFIIFMIYLSFFPLKKCNRFSLLLRINACFFKIIDILSFWRDRLRLFIVNTEWFYFYLVDITDDKRKYTILDVFIHNWNGLIFNRKTLKRNQMLRVKK